MNRLKSMSERSYYSAAVGSNEVDYGSYQRPEPHKVGQRSQVPGLEAQNIPA